MNTQSNTVENQESRFYEVLRSIYLDESLKDCDRRLYAYNVCIKEWQHLVPNYRSSEPDATRLHENGRFNDDIPHDFKDEVKVIDTSVDKFMIEFEGIDELMGAKYGYNTSTVPDLPTQPVLRHYGKICVETNYSNDDRDEWSVEDKVVQLSANVTYTVSRDKSIYMELDIHDEDEDEGELLPIHYIESSNGLFSLQDLGLALWHRYNIDFDDGNILIYGYSIFKHANDPRIQLIDDSNS